MTAAPEAVTAAPAGGDRRGDRPGRGGGCAVTAAVTAQKARGDGGDRRRGAETAAVTAGAAR